MAKNIAGKQILALASVVLGLPFIGGSPAAVSAAQAQLPAVHFIREEARPRYLYVLADMWDLRIFVKIAERAEAHRRCRLAIEKYNISTQQGDPARGVHGRGSPEAVQRAE